jgi:hypothetical protein
VHIAKAGVRFERQQHTAEPMPFIFMISALGLTRLQWERDQQITQQLTRSLVITAQRDERIIWARLLRQDIRHVPEIIASNLADAPALV